LWEEDELRAETLRIDAPAARSARPANGVWLGPFRRWDGYREAVRQALGREEPEAQPDEARERIGV
jgi:hypothetical protein